MTDRPWLSSYPQGVPADIDASHYPSLVALMEESFSKYADRTAYSFMGKDISYGETDKQSKAFAAYLQGLGLVKGDRVAAMMPNCPQYPIAVAAILRAGLILVNVNPLYTPRELEHQLKDSGAKAIIIMENFGTTLQQCIASTPIKHIVLASMGDRLGFLKGALVNYVVRNVKKLVPHFSLPGAVRFNDALDKGASGSVKPVAIGPDDVAVLQYTGGTTGVSKGAVLLHRNVIANVLQSEAWNEPAMAKVPANEQPTGVCALPLYHIFAFTVGMMLSMRTGGKLILIPNPRDIPAVLKELSKHTIHSFPAVNTLFNGLANHPDFNTVNWKNLKISVGGGMAVQAAVAKLWLEKTGCPICEGYGLSETSPSTTCNPTNSTAYTGTIGLPLPGTWLKLLDDEGNEVPLGERGEIAIKGPQVMAGYWQRPDETAKVMTPDGYFKSGDIGVVDERGYFKVVDRKKDMILVSGFNVYPNEVEDVVALIPGVLECAAVGVPDEKTGEAVKLVIVKKDPSLTEAQVREYCRANLTGYKQPRIVEFRTEMPKTPVGKILRRELRDSKK
ncbi:MULTISPECIES: long-chain-fatty-acid--CoA ligase [Variovorax]|jgi:long-chain acyl-CoA synthetase|uniref:long-chain-fatty-acid--CoA ligase n=1 Tax=Variovorax TaxID=34072 RepID=UPI00086B7161|nr:MULTISPECIES: long-chain-fatty-acid--CoA ligase [Variovorax]MBN8757484.1 long-chain-fatty-acid--CoA ligase [Variovorax sp.]ODU12246.1 MAG: long-chain fatty acid--CoA ligase [Variovorax sp. SCN 67-85]ODV16658.1 MAG: long-chain fatty acid--CoA ligase [Variovorax sp. SCN 67-20]OJZ12465.1 MAG: long-chain fatty acid--CoA ligase [Variovorax sp. 67-131]UKI09193.1 long-chain-fatty-acid--CoA ligase [Variovorax paradoxus]